MPCDRESVKNLKIDLLKLSDYDTDKTLELMKVDALLQINTSIRELIRAVRSGNNSLNELSSCVNTVKDSRGKKICNRMVIDGFLQTNISGIVRTQECRERDK